MLKDKYTFCPYHSRLQATYSALVSALSSEHPGALIKSFSYCTWKYHISPHIRGYLCIIRNL
jgi:hypothetical protein